MMKKPLIALALITLAVAPACTNDEGETESPVSVTVDLEDQAGLTDVDPPSIVLIPSILLTSSLKNPNALNIQGFSDVQINEYTVVYRRADGGTRLPPAQKFAAGVVLPTPGTVTLNDFPVLSGTDLQRSPFDQLLPFNGGFDRETGSNEIRLFYDITFYGRTVSGHRVRSETATGIRVFVDF